MAQGLAGLVLLEDEASGKLRLPMQWGEDDVPLIFRDKQLTQDGTRIDYQLDIMRAAVGWFGDLMLTNGVRSTRCRAAGCGCACSTAAMRARCTSPPAIDVRCVVASDGGLLAEPVKVESLPLLPGERFEVLVDTSDGKTFDIVTLPVTQMGMTLAPFDQPLPLVQILPLRVMASGTLPDQLVDAAAAGNGRAAEPLAAADDGSAVGSAGHARSSATVPKAMGSQHGAGKAMDHGSMNMDHGAMDHGNMDHGDMAMDQGNHASSAAYDFHNGNKINGRPLTWKSPCLPCRWANMKNGPSPAKATPCCIRSTFTARSSAFCPRTASAGASRRLERYGQRQRLAQ